MCVQETGPESKKRILPIGAGNHILHVLDTDEHVDPGRSKQRMKKESGDSMLLLVMEREPTSVLWFSLRQSWLCSAGTEPIIRRPGQSVRAYGVQKEMQMGSKVLVPHTRRFMTKLQSCDDYFSTNLGQ